jgi:hypothetical protein
MWSKFYTESTLSLYCFLHEKFLKDATEKEIPKEETSYKGNVRIRFMFWIHFVFWFQEIIL